VWCGPKTLPRVRILPLETLRSSHPAGESVMIFVRSLCGPSSSTNDKCGPQMNVINAIGPIIIYSPIGRRRRRRNNTWRACDHDLDASDPVPSSCGSSESVSSGSSRRRKRRRRRRRRRKKERELVGPGLGRRGYYITRTAARRAGWKRGAFVAGPRVTSYPGRYRYTYKHTLALPMCTLHYIIYYYLII